MPVESVVLRAGLRRGFGAAGGSGDSSFSGTSSSLVMRRRLVDGRVIASSMSVPRARSVGGTGGSLTSFAEARVTRRVVRCGWDVKKREVSSVALGARIFVVVRRWRIMGGLLRSLVIVMEVVARDLGDLLDCSVECGAWSE